MNMAKLEPSRQHQTVSGDPPPHPDPGLEVWIEVPHSSDSSIGENPDFSPASVTSPRLDLSWPPLGPGLVKMSSVPQIESLH